MTDAIVPLSEHVVSARFEDAPAEAVAATKRLLLDALSNGSADSFALRNHGMKALVPGQFPERAFPATYMLKDLSYALELTEQNGLALRNAQLAGDLLREAIAAGHGEEYWPTILHAVER